jgi:hypothetical protein
MGHGFDGLEIYNHGCQCEIGKGYAVSHWDEILEFRPTTIGIAVDDAHFRPESMFWGGGWVVASAAACTRDAILDAIRRGRFYASQGPSFQSIEVEGARLNIRTSPIRFARLIGPRHRGIWIHEPGGFREASFRLPVGWGRVRLEIEDADKNRAWTNPIQLP